MARTINIDGHRLLWYLGLFGLTAFTLFGLHGSLEIPSHLDLYNNSDTSYLWTSHAWGVAAAIIISLFYGLFADSSKIRNTAFFLVMIVAFSGYLLGGAQSYTFNGFVVGLLPLVIGSAAASLAFTEKEYFFGKIVSSTIAIATIVVAGQALYLLGNDTVIDKIYQDYQHLFFLVALGVGVILTLAHLFTMRIRVNPVPIGITVIGTATALAIFNIVYWSVQNTNPANISLVWETLIAFAVTVVLGGVLLASKK